MTDQSKDPLNQPIPPNAQGINSLDPSDPIRKEFFEYPYLEGRKASDDHPDATATTPILRTAATFLINLINVATIFITTILTLMVLILFPYWTGLSFTNLLNLETPNSLYLWLFGIPMLTGIVIGFAAVFGLVIGYRDTVKNVIFRMKYGMGVKLAKNNRKKD